LNKPNYVAEAPYQPGYEDAVVTEPKPFFCGIYKSKPLTDEELCILALDLGLGAVPVMKFARAIEERHGIK
jgi:hypothetical protein